MIRVLIVDDSPTMRALLAARLRGEPGIEVIGTAADAAEARVMMRALDPDVVTLDVEMPGMNGLDFLEKIMRLRPTPVIIVSSWTEKGTETAARALALGAVDIYAKRSVGGRMMSDDGGELAALIRGAAGVSLSGSALSPARAVSLSSSREVRLIAIGSSTGGVEALHTVLGAFPADCPPTLVVQHINANFAAAVARRLDGHCAPRVMIAEPDIELRPGHVYFAPGGERHLQVRGGTRRSVKLRSGDPVSGHRPSVDALFHSVAEEAAAGSVGILLTGMGSDGARGLLAMRQAGCLTIAQDESTSTVYGMPRVAAELGAAEIVLGLPAVAGHALRGVRA